MVVEYRAESTHLTPFMTKQKKKSGGMQSGELRGVERRGERPDPAQPYRLRKNGRHGTYAIAEWGW